MAKITRTYGPIHFEDLDPHRFEDLIRELIYDYKDWQSIEATGRSGSDDGFDIRAYERLSGPAIPQDVDDEEDRDQAHPMQGNRWMVQCKREKEIGPKKLTEILNDIDAAAPPYGYILAASATFSKQSYDSFRDTLLKKGVMEFYLWGKPELEGMLHLPKNDRILFTFFGISLLSRRRSRSTEIRFSVNNKNKLFRILGEENAGHRSILLRDSKDDKYPYKGEYQDFQEHPRWREYTATDYHPLGLIAKVNRYFAYIDADKKEFDYAPSASLIFRQSDDDEQRAEQHKLQSIAEDFWEHLPLRHQAHFCRDGLLRYDQMLVIDDKGDTWHHFPHIFVDFEGTAGPFAGFFEYLEVDPSGYGHHTRHRLEEWKKIEVFPKTFPEPTIGKVHLDKEVEFDDSTLRAYVHGNRSIRTIYDVDGKYDFLEVRDIIPLAKTGTGGNSREYIEITNKRTLSVKDYLNQSNDRDYAKSDLEQRVRRSVKNGEKLAILEFRRTYEWKFNSERKSVGPK